MKMLWNLLLVSVILSMISIGIQGCAVLNPDIQGKLDVLAEKHDGLIKRIDELKGKIFSGDIDPMEGLAAISVIAQEAKGVLDEVKKLNEGTGIPTWQVVLAGMANMAILFFGGKEYLAGKNALLTIVRLIDKARKGGKNAEQLKAMIMHKKNPVIDRVAEALPPMAT